MNEYGLPHNIVDWQRGPHMVPTQDRMKDFYGVIERGCTLIIPVKVQDNDGQPIDLTGYEGIFTVKRSLMDYTVADEEAVLQHRFDIPDATGGEFIIELTSLQMNFAPGDYFFDILLHNTTTDTVARITTMKFRLTGGPSNAYISDNPEQFTGNAIIAKMCRTAPIQVSVEGGVLEGEFAVLMRALQEQLNRIEGYGSSSVEGNVGLESHANLQDSTARNYFEAINAMLQAIKTSLESTDSLRRVITETAEPILTKLNEHESASSRRAQEIIRIQNNCYGILEKLKEYESKVTSIVAKSNDSLYQRIANKVDSIETVLERSLLQFQETIGSAVDMKRLAQEVQTLATLVEGLRDTFEAEIASATSPLSVSISEHQTRLGQIDAVISTITQTLSQIDSTISNLTGQVQSISDSLEDISGEIGEIHQSISALQQGLIGQGDMLGTHAGLLEQHAQSIDDYSTRILNLESTVAGQQESIENAVTNLRAGLEEAKQLTSEQVGKVQAEGERLQQLFNAMTHDFQRVERFIKDAKERYHTYDESARALAQLQQRVTRLELHYGNSSPMPFIPGGNNSVTITPSMPGLGKDIENMPKEMAYTDIPEEFQPAVSAAIDNHYITPVRTEGDVSMYQLSLTDMKNIKSMYDNKMFGVGGN